MKEQPSFLNRVIDVSKHLVIATALVAVINHATSDKKPEIDEEKRTEVLEIIKSKISKFEDNPTLAFSSVSDCENQGVSPEICNASGMVAQTWGKAIIQAMNNISQNPDKYENLAVAGWLALTEDPTESFPRFVDKSGGTLILDFQEEIYGLD